MFAVADRENSVNLQVITNGVVSGLVLAVLAMSFSLVYLPTRVFHIALAGVIAATPYIALACMKAGYSWWVSSGAAVLVAVAISILCELLNHRRLERKGAAGGSHLVASLGMYIIISQIIAMIWGNDVQTLRYGLDQTFAMGSVIIAKAQAASALVSLVLLAGIYSWLRWSNFGLRFRALADNAVEFGLHGYNVYRYRLLAFALSGLLAGSGSLLFAYDVGFDPQGGMHMMLLAVVAVIIGGRASFMGPMLGGFLLGIIRAQVVWHFSARWQDVCTFLLLAAFLYLRPSGLCGHTIRLEANE
jgi:branched-chain amino acid transport system permease protein